jgi:simple sugar transport system permease protein
MRRRILYGLAAPVAAFVVAVVVSSIALLLSGNSPVTAFREMWETIDSIESVVIIVNKAVPYYIAGVAAAIGFKMGLFNIGVEGQYRLAALMAAAVGVRINFPAPIHVGIILLVAIATGAAWAAIAGLLKIYRGVNEVISTIMLNYIAFGFIAWLLMSHFRNPSSELVAETKVIPTTGWVDSLNGLFSSIGLDLPDGVVLQGFLPFAIVLGIAYYVLLFRSRFGYELRASGINPFAARSSGVNPRGMVMKTICLSGAVAGLIGMPFLLADPQFHKYGDQFPKLLGFTGLSLALLGRNHPAGIAAAALFWGLIERATQRLSIIGMPQEIGLILQGSFLLAAVIAYEVVRRRSEAATVREAAAQAQARPDPGRPEPLPAGAPS